MTSILIKAVSIFSFIFIVTCANAETEKREYSQGEVILEYARFEDKSKTKEDLESLKTCGNCPGIDGYLPDIVIDKILLRVRSDIFIIPQDLTAGLFNPHIGPNYKTDAFFIKQKPYGVLINLSGGDGTGSYKVSFKIDLIDMHVKRSLFQYPHFDKPLIKEGNLK